MRRGKKRKSLTVFIADDSESVRERLAAMLGEMEGVKIVGWAGTRPEVVDSVFKLRPDVVILDIQMPGGNGFAALEEVKKTKSPPVVIILTNSPYPQYREKCMELKAEHFFDKSREFTKVVEVLKQLASSEAEHK